MRILRVASLCAALVLAVDANPKRVYTELEFAALPDFCQARFRGSPAERKAWGQRLGSEYLHIHHYCMGLLYFDRAQRNMDWTERRGQLTQAIGEFGYVLKRWPSDYPLSTQARLKSAMAEQMLGTR